MRSGPCSHAQRTSTTGRPPAVRQAPRVASGSWLGARRAAILITPRSGHGVGFMAVIGQILITVHSGALQGRAGCRWLAVELRAVRESVSELAELGDAGQAIRREQGQCSSVYSLRSSCTRLAYWLSSGSAASVYSLPPSRTTRKLPAEIRLRKCLYRFGTRCGCCDLACGLAG